MRSVRFGRVVGSLIVLALALPPIPVAAEQSNFCGDVQFIWARGSNRQPDDAEFQVVDADLRARIGPGVTYSSYQLGKDGGFGGFAYPAGGGALIDLILEGTDLIAGAYAASVEQGRLELDAYLTDRAAECAGEVYVLAGWSQGAQVIGEGVDLLNQSIQDRIAYVALFGDPVLNTGFDALIPAELAGPFLAACNGNPKPWIRGSAPCWNPGGVLGRRDPYVPQGMDTRVGSWCRGGDGSCTSLVQDILFSTFPAPTGQHFRYFEPDGDSAMAIREAVESLQDFLPDQANDLDASWIQFASGMNGADLVFVFDTTGSMGGEIADAKAQATALAEAWLALTTNGRVALVQFRDQGDAFVSRLELPLTDDADAFQTAIDGLAAGGGGDTPEAQLSGLMTALNDLDWQDGATKAAIVITDAIGKDPEPITGFTRAQVSQRALEIDPVAIFGVNVITNQSVTDWMQPMATATAGEVFVLQPGESLADLLFEVIDVVAFNPVATLNGPYIAETDTPVHFRTIGSFDADAELVSYEWDFDGDGTADQTTTTPSIDHTYAGVYHGLAAVRVISSDGGSALATAEVSVDGVGLSDDYSVAPVSATASVTGSGQVTVTWTPASNDRATGYKVYRADGELVRFTSADGPDSVVFTGLDLSASTPFAVVASNGFGDSVGRYTPPVGGIAWLPSVKTNDDAGTTQQDRPSVALGPDGATYLIWDDYRPGTQADIYFSRRDPSTGTWSANQKVNNDTSGRTQWNADIAVDGSNNAYAVWQDPRNGNKTPDTDIYFSKRTASNGTWGANVRVNNDTQGAPEQITPRIGIKSDGAAVAVWVDRRSNQWNIYSSRLAAGASTWGPNMRITTNTTSRKNVPDVVVGADGTAYAVWEDDRQSGNYDIWYSTLAPGSSTWTSEVKLSDDPGTRAQYGARIGIDAAGNLVVAWLDDRPYPKTEVRVSRRVAGGSTWAASAIVTDAPANAVAVDLAIKADGNAFAVWQDARGSSYDIWGSYYTAGSATWSAPAVVSDDPGSTAQMRPTVAINNTEIAAAWVDLRAGNSDIRSRRRTPS